MLDYIMENDLSKAVMKYDFQIVSIAITKNADCIYSYDPDLKKFGEGYIDVREMPNIAPQMGISFND